jgi:PQQ-dependent catabolism-associated beta-propeller protein
MKRDGPTPQRQLKLPPLAVEGQGTRPGKREENLPRMRKSVLVLLCALANSPAAAKDTGLIFVSNEKTNNIVAIDPTSYKIVKEIKTARRPRDLQFNADHSKLYVACGDDDVIDIVDVAKLEVAGQLKTGPSPEAFGIDEKRGRLYVSQEEGSSLAVIDMERDTIVQEVPTGAEPEGVLVSEDGKTFYVTSEAGDLLHEVAADSGRIVRDVVAGLRPRRIAATPDGKELWVTAELAGEVDIVDRATFAITGKIPFLPPGMRKSEVTPVGLVMTKDGRTAFVALGHAAHVALVDVPARKVLGYILVGKRPWGLTLSRDESTSMSPTASATTSP